MGRSLSYFLAWKGIDSDRESGIFIIVGLISLTGSLDGFLICNRTAVVTFTAFTPTRMNLNARVVITGNVSVATHVARNRCWEIQRDTTCEPQLRNSKMPSTRGTRVPTIRKIAARSIRRIFSHSNSHIHVVYLRCDLYATRNDSRDRNLWKNGGRVISSNDRKDWPRKVVARLGPSERY